MKMKLDSNAIRSRQLGIPHGTAQNRLRKQVMFHLIQKSGMDTCHRCCKKIESIDYLSIEHKTPWLHSDDPKKLFFDIENIAFSHTKCNYASSRRQNQHTKPCPSYAAYQRGCRCEECKEYKRLMTRESNRRKRSNGVLI